MMCSGVIFDIKEFAIYDGPGVRQTIFFKGCPLRCNWCHNPEGLETNVQLMVNYSSCTKCQKCNSTCPNLNCISCGKCVSACPLNLRKICGQSINATDLAELIKKDSEYYNALDGGVTFSGGEPLLQWEFLLEVLNFIPTTHKAIETCGYAKSEIFQQVISQMDYVMMDLKIIDSELHKKYTLCDNAMILENLQFLCKSNKPFVIRIPLIPSVNDTLSNLNQTAKLIYKAENLQGVELLPYHKTAGAKYSMLGKQYSPMFDINEAVRVSKNIFEKFNIRSKIL